MRNLKAALRAVLDTRSSDRYHFRHAKQAAKALKSIESAKKKTPISDIKRCDEYAVDVLGNKHFAPWLYVYTAVSGEFKIGWIPDNYYGAIVIPKITGAYSKVSSLKPLNAAVLHSDLFLDLASHVNGIFFDDTYAFMPPEDVKDLLFKSYDKVVFKLDGSLRGIGVHVWDRESFSVPKVKKLGNGLFQGFIRQHEFFDELQKNSVATLRITTFYEDDGAVSVRACYLRLGSGSETHVQTESHIRIPIDWRNGAFSDLGYTVDWMELERHPLSKVRFSGRTIPNYSECARAVSELHKQVPYARCIGWDVAVDRDENVRIMEWNAGHNDIKFTEATQGPCFSDLGWEVLGQE